MHTHAYEQIFLLFLQSCKLLQQYRAALFELINFGS